MHRRTFLTLLAASASTAVLPANAFDDTAPMHGLIGKMRAAPGQRAALATILLEQRGGAPVQAVMQPGATVGTSHMVIEAPAGPLFSGQIGADIVRDALAAVQ